jgi:hypothetical protein
MAVSYIGGGCAVPGENHWSVESHWQTLSHNVVSCAHRHERDSNSQHLVIINTDCTGSCKRKLPETLISVRDYDFCPRLWCIVFELVEIFDHGLVQIAEEPTQESNIHVLIITNYTKQLEQNRNNTWASWSCHCI